MKPITSILLVLALICYVFLPFYEISFQGGLTGLSFTAGTISQRFSLLNTLFALLPFISCFVALGCNSLKNRWWGLAVALCIIAGLWFMRCTCNIHEVALRHAPDVTPRDDLGEGFAIIGLGIGFKATFILLVAALVSTFISMLPFKFNERIERAVDDTIDHGLEDMRSLGNRMSEEVREWRHEHLSKHGRKPHHDDKPQDAQPPALPPQDPEDPLRFMPK